MYFNQNNNFYHGIMFHHFHDNGIHTKGQGSINKDDFYKMINFIGRNNILDADVFYEKLKNNKLKNNEVCLTFDDAIKCQIDIALPILEELKIIKKHLPRFNKVSILIDDIRDFNNYESNSNNDYPDKMILINWGLENGFNWEIIYDILVLTN